MVARSRALTPADSAVGSRIRQVRVEARLSQRAAAEEIGLSRDQLNRIERGAASIRYFAGWSFCRITGTNPLWLAFGEPEARPFFFEIANSAVPANALFLDVVQQIAPAYRAHRAKELEAMESAVTFFTEEKNSEAPSRTVEEKFALVESLIKYYLSRQMAATPGNWEELRPALRRKTDSPEGKAELSSLLGVSPAAISQWRSGTARPDADNTLRILAWVRGFPATPQRKESARTVGAVRAPKTRDQKSKRNEKPKSDQNKPK